MFDNIQKFILHLLSSNVGEVILLIAGLGFRDESGFSVFPISPIQILWINMITSSFPAFGLGREKASPDVMRRRQMTSVAEYSASRFSLTWWYTVYWYVLNRLRPLKARDS